MFTKVEKRTFILVFNSCKIQKKSKLISNDRGQKCLLLGEETAKVAMDLG
jgi:hypothetical protein